MPNLPRTLSRASLVLLVALSAGAAPAAEPVDWLREYLRIDTTNPPGNEHRAAGFLRRILHREGVPTELIVSATGRANLVARLQSPAGERGALVLLHHMDVVPPGEGWTVEPYGGVSGDGYLWGRGAIDDKSLGIAHLAAFLDLRRSGVELARDVMFVAVADEESGGGGGTAWLLEQFPALFSNVAAVLGEGGQNRVYNQRLGWWGIEVAQKRPLWLRVTSHGRGGHGSILNLHTAPHRLVRALHQLVERQPTLRVTDEVRRYFEAVSPYETAHFQNLVGQLDDIVADPQPGRLLMPGMPSYLADSIQVNVLSAGSRINTAPEEASALVDVRMLPDTDQEALLAELRELVGNRTEIEVLLSSPPVEPSPVDNEIYGCLEDLLSDQAPVIPAFIPGVTDSRYFRLRGIPAYGFSPFALESPDLRGIHGVDEKIQIEAFEEGVETMKRVVRSCAAA